MIKECLYSPCLSKSNNIKNKIPIYIRTPNLVFTTKNNIKNLSTLQRFTDLIVALGSSNLNHII